MRLWKRPKRKISSSSSRYLKMDTLETILSNTYTKKDLSHRLYLLREFLEERLFSEKKNANIIYQLNEFFEKKKEKRDEFNALVAWGYDFFEIFNTENLYTKLKEIEDKVGGLPVVTVYLPIFLPIYEIPKLGDWIRKNVQAGALVDLKADPQLIGGCALVWKGTYKDYSLRYYLDKSKEAIKRVVADYLPKSSLTAAGSI